MAFDILSHTDDTRTDLVLQARWAVQDCGRDFGCVEVLGYIIMCRVGVTVEIRRTVWMFEVVELRGAIASMNLSARPFTTYQCSMASFNGNGIGFYGSRVELAGVELGMSPHPSSLRVPSFPSFLLPPSLPPFLSSPHL